MALVVDQNGRTVPSVLDWTVPDTVSLSAASAAVTPPANTVEIHMIADVDFYINHVSPAANTDYLVKADTEFILASGGVDGVPWDGSAVKFYVFGSGVGTLRLMYLKK